jgi:low affinity Fe/Cu permease
MNNNICIIETEQIDEKVQKIIRQTDYTQEIALEKLKENNFDEVETIRGFLGINNNKKTTEIKSINQEIYKQLRQKLDSNMRDYKVRVERGEVKKIV